MGLLTNEKSKNALIKFLLAHDNKLCCLAYLAGLTWFLALAYQPLNAGTYFSENALLPGLVESELPSMFTAALEIKDEIKAEMEKDNKVTPQAWIFRKFREIGLETYLQNFSIIYPFRSVTKQVATGENVFSIMRARRAASTEALVLSIPLRPLINVNKERPATHGGIALALALAKEFKSKPYWSKDLIFLFSDYDEIGTIAWLDAYHQTESQFIVGNDLQARSGPIQAAINLELPIEDVNYYNLLLEGLNGQLPNLDLVNLVVRLCRRERSQVAIHHLMEKRRHQFSDSHGESLEDFKLSLSTMLRMMWYQASGAPSGNHGMFHKFHIEALTIQGVVKKKGSYSGITMSARIVEGIFRSLNNLLERFHQSFFFYLLPATNRYVSIGMYMPAFGLMIAASLIKGITMWIVCGDLKEKRAAEEKKLFEDLEKSKDTKKEEDKQQEEKKEESEKAAEEVLAKMREKLQEDGKEEDIDDEDDADPRQHRLSELEGEEHNLLVGLSFSPSWSDFAPLLVKLSDTPNSPHQDERKPSRARVLLFIKNNPANQGMLSITPMILVSLLLGWMAHQGPELLMRIMPKFRIHTEDMVIYSMLAIFTAAVMYPKLMTRKSKHPNSLLIDWRLLKSLALIGQTLALACVALLNISQAFFVAAFMVPVTCCVIPCKSRILRWIQMSALVLVSPIILMFLVGMISAWPQTSTLDLVVKGYTNAKHLIFLGLMDAYLFDAWSETIATAVIFPLWLLFWAVPWADPSL